MNLAEAVERVHNSKLKEQAAAIASAIRPAIRFEYRDDERESPGCCKLGGKPDLPKGAEWPSAPYGRPLAFLAQFDLSKCRVDSKEWHLPSDGLLSFFYDAENQPWGIEAKDFRSWRVLHTKAGESLLATPFPKKLDSDARFKPVVLKPHLVFSLPSRTTISELQLAPLVSIDDAPGSTREGVESVPGLAYDDLCEELESAPGLTESSPQLGGWPREIQNEMSGAFARLLRDEPPAPRQVPNPFKPGQMMTVMGSPATDVPPAVRSLLKDTQDWTLLLQLPSDEDDGPGWMWGDVGRLYYWMPRKSLRAKQFDDVWLELQCY